MTSKLTQWTEVLHSNQIINDLQLFPTISFSFVVCFDPKHLSNEQQKISENVKSNGNPLEKVSARQQSSPLQVQSLNNDESPKRSSKRKSFTKRKKKRKRAKQQKAKKLQRIVEHRHRDEGEDFILRHEGSNYSAAENNCERKRRVVLENLQSMEGKLMSSCGNSALN